MSSPALARDVALWLTSTSPPPGSKVPTLVPRGCRRCWKGLTIGQAGDWFEGDLMGDDASAWPGLLASSTEEAHAAVAQPGAVDRTVHLSFGDTSGQEYVVQLTADLAIHAWDLARAAGQDDTLDLGAAALLLPWAEANAGLLTASCMFGSPVDTRPDPPDDVRLPGLLGRRA